MKRKTSTLWNSFASWLLWLSPASILALTIHDVLFPMPAYVIVVLGVMWIVLFPLGIRLHHGRIPESAANISHITAVCYILYLIFAFQFPNNHLRRHLAEVRIGSPAQAALHHMSSYQEVVGGKTWYGEGPFDHPQNYNGEERRFFSHRNGDYSCLAVIGIRDGRVIHTSTMELDSYFFTLVSPK
jgi:hypothetical protein